MLHHFRFSGFVRLGFNLVLKLCKSLSETCQIFAKFQNFFDRSEQNKPGSEFGLTGEVPREVSMERNDDFPVVCWQFQAVDGILVGAGRVAAHHDEPLQVIPSSSPDRVNDDAIVVIQSVSALLCAPIPLLRRVQQPVLIQSLENEFVPVVSEPLRYLSPQNPQSLFHLKFKQSFYSLFGFLFSSWVEGLTNFPTDSYHELVGSDLTNHEFIESDRS